MEAAHQATANQISITKSKRGNSLQVARIDRNCHADWLRNDPTYRTRLERALEQNTQAVEDEAMRRAIEGERRPVLYKGKQVYVSVSSTAAWDGREWF